MKFSAFNYNFKFNQDGVKHNVLYNTLYGSILLLNDEIKINNIKSLDKESYDVFKANKFIIPDDLNEVDLLRSQNKLQRFNDLTLELTILPTRWCNLNCQYCFENRKDVHMSDDDIEAIYNFVVKKIDKLKCISLLWFGGEPLLQIDKIESLSKRVNNLAKKNKIQFKNSIITNGTLLDEKANKRLLDVGIKYVQITLDGPPKVHNKRKPTIAGKNTFDIVFENIKRASKVFDLSIRINIDKENRSKINKLIDLLAENNFQDKVYIYIAKVENVSGACSNISGTCLKDADFLNSEHKTLDYIKRKGFTKTAIPSYRINYCTADNLHSFSFLPESKVHKCWHVVGEEDEVVGELSKDGDISYNNKLYKWLAYDPLDDSDCRKCKVLPLCMGGCPKNKIIDQKKRCDILKNIIENYLKKQTIDYLKEGEND